MRKGLVLPLTLIIMMSVTVISVALLNRTSSTTSELFQRISKAQLQVDGGNAFFANFGYLKRKFAEESYLNLSTDNFYISLTSTPTMYEDFLGLFVSDTLEYRAWKDLFSKFSSEQFYRPGFDLTKVFDEVTGGTFDDMILIPYTSSPNTLLAIVKTSKGNMSAYFWGLASPRFFSNWSRFELESNSTAFWNPGSVIYGPTFFGSVGQGGAGNGGFRMKATIPPDPDDISDDGPIFNGEVWYENANIDLSGKWVGKKTIRVDTDGDGDYDERFNNKNYAVHVENGETWIFLEGFDEVLVADSYEEVPGELRVKGSVVDFVDNASSGDFNSRFLSWFLRAGSNKVSQETIEDLETRFDEMEDYYSSHYSNITSLEDLLNALERGTSLPQNSLGLYLKDTERSSGSQVSETETLQQISYEDSQWLETLLINDNDFLDAFEAWIVDDDHRKLSANSILGKNDNITDDSFTYEELREIISSDHVTLSGFESPIIEERRNIVQSETTGSLSILDSANSVTMSSDVLLGSPLNNLVGPGAFESSTSYSVIKYQWDREVRSSSDSHQIRERTRVANRYPVQYETSTIAFSLVFTGWEWRLSGKSGPYQKGPRSWSLNSSIEGPVAIAVWSDWNYSQWSDWEVIGGSGGNGQKVADADVYMYLITPSDGFSEINFDTTVIMKVNSENEEDYPSFTTEATTLSNRGYYVVEEDIETGGSGIPGGIGTTLGREATVIDGRYTIRSKEGDIRIYGDILYNDMLNDSTFRSYVDEPGLAFDPDYDPNESASNASLNDMLNLVATNGNIVMPYQSNSSGRDAIKNIKLFTNLFAFGKNSGHSNTGQILIDGYDRYNVDMGFRHLFGTMVSIEAGPAGTLSGGFRSRNYYDERLYGNEDLPFASPESNILEVMGTSMR
ncbi:hypothetical protein DS66_00500 [Mesotoga sp. SC_3PWM13N19]|jgi:hypothetical protein|uniref:hypothetical protein n=1 Tax=Mesotoga sp. UBA5847 TaxID=1946859 RepID=UPI000DBF6567|nr:hypothetical protein [Mesotoga sp. UBA5847]RAM59960.1 hypothetical protein DS66_00500 [Mesotoga sp. SC_3PWM13N19]